ncbi:MAG: carboxypeptidase regulatory-like domain-containing protein, partial [Candidatus Kerfeldbacteria bacterium]|nr:carboxypeptidase regulatory-like domain-containing protein [Candidatus Kerfeldbacteria bacterium]
MNMSFWKKSSFFLLAVCALMLVGANTARAESPYISDVTVETSSNEPGELSIYTFTVTFSDALDASEDGGSLWWNTWGQCRQEENFDSCNPDFSDAAVVSNDLGDLPFTPNDGQEAPSGGWFDLFGANITPGTYTIVMNGIVNGPEEGTYTIGMSASVSGEEPTEDSSTMSTFLLGTPVVQGTLYRAGGTTPVGCGEGENCPWVSLHDEFWTVESGTSSDSNGNFYIFDMNPGTYQLSVWINSPIEGEIAPDPINVTVVAGQTVEQDVTLVAATKTITGTVLDNNGDPVDDAQVSANSQSGGGWASANTDAEGNYTLNLASGVYMLNVQAAWGENGQAQVDWVFPDDRPLTVEFQDNDSEESFTQNFTVTRTTSTVFGVVNKPDGTRYGRDLWIRLSGKEGQGFGGNTNEDSEFTIPALPGTYRVEVSSWGTRYYGPELSVTVGADQNVDIGTITLQEMTAVVIGVVEDQNGTPLEGISVNSWGETGFGEAQTESDGSFTMYVPSGKRELMAEDRENRSYIYTGEPIRYTATDNSTTDVGTITLQASNARLFCTAVDTDGNRLDSLNGWVGLFVTDGPPMSGGELSRGTCGTQGISIVAGTYGVDVWMDDRTQYSMTERVSFTVAENESANVDLVFAANDARLFGRIVDENGDAITGVDMFVFADSHEKGLFYEGFVDPSNGTYEISMLGGNAVTLGVFVPKFAESEDPGAPRFLNGPSGGEPITVPSDSEVEEDIVVKTADASLVGQVLDPDGNAVSHGFIWCSSITPEQFLDEGFDEGEIFSGAETSQDGTFDVPLTSTSSWNCGTGRTNEWLSADMFSFSPASGEAVEHDFQFNQADGTIHGSVTFEDGSTPDRAWVVAFTPDGKFTETEAIDGSYTLPVSGDTTWMIIGETDVEGELYRSSEQEVAVGDTPDETVNLVLVPFADIPPAYSTTFDFTQPLTVTLEDGFSLTLEANAAGTEGNGTLTITPASGMARTNVTQPVWYGYNIIITNTSDGTPVTELASAAQITMPYTDKILAQQGFSESDLTGMTYDPALGSWNGADSVQIDTVNKVILITISHLSSFSVMSNGGTTSTSTGTTADHNLYLTGRTTAGPNVRVVDETGEQIETFMAYSPTLRGTWKAVGGDVDGDGLRDVMTAAGTSHGSHVRAFMGDGTLIDDFFAYDAGF